MARSSVKLCEDEDEDKTHISLSSRDHVTHLGVVFLPAFKPMQMSSSCTSHCTQVVLSWQLVQERRFRVNAVLLPGKLATR